ncbi:hypothetical protein EJ03DRAFT_276006 [Teratosphaeria nubilosa]|uniref:intramembrane prenyl-peptidase Rce1 n=1 Tax=Teratosphaeria nubilosa TaxID=161662 RepID=A0A6G1L5G6_9PEZI|nr:hypothetical protein EJ03DRAFT_276006 [Teratosphaeria nubilosa]
MSSSAGSRPRISEQTALLCVILYTVIYIAPFYLSSTLRSTPLQSRDAPNIIRARVRAVGLSCLASTGLAIYMLAVPGQATPRDIARLLGLWPIIPVDVLKTLALVAVLFIGPMYEVVVVDREWRGWSLSALKEGLYDSWIGYRNVVIAPASEELVFRALTISLYLLAQVSPSRIVFTTPLIFGLAHVHHLAEYLQSRTPEGRRFPPLPVWVAGILRSTFQFGFTSLFGFFAAFVFLRTGSLYAASAAHSFCNWQGFPRVTGRVGQDTALAPLRATPDVAQGKRDEDADVSARNLGIAWTWAYYALLVVGAFGFYKLLFPLTESSNALATF